MNKPARIRVVMASALVTSLFVTVAGCGGKSTPTRDFNDNPLPAPASPMGGADDTKGQQSNSSTTPPRKIDPGSGVGKDAFEFLKSLGEGTAKADKVSGGLVKMIGLPAELPADKSRGYSTLAAETWLKQVGSGVTFALPTGFAGADAAVLWGGFQGPGRKGDYSLRMIHEGGAWKVDYLALTSARFGRSPETSGGSKGEYEGFAARAVAGLLCDKTGMPKDARALALAAGLTPPLRAKLAEPFGSDKGQGFDFNRGKLLLEAEKFGGNAESYTTTQQGKGPEFRLEVTKSGGAKSAYLLKMVKGTTPGQWLVDCITPQ